MGCCHDKHTEPLTVNLLDKWEYQFKMLQYICVDDTEKLKKGLDEGFPISYKMPVFEGATLLHLAAKFGTEDMCKIILKRGADPNAIDDAGLTPVFHAIREDRWGNVDKLLNFGKAKINITTRLGITVYDHIRGDEKQIEMKKNYLHMHE